MPPIPYQQYLIMAQLQSPLYPSSPSPSLFTTRGILPVDPISPSSPNPLDILPHILLFLVLLLAYFPPPFRGRGILVCTLIALLDWRSTVSAWPPNIGDTRPMKYGIASSWIFVLPVVQRILLQSPEKEFRRVADTEGDPAPPEWSWRKLRWSVSLYSTPRAVGWNFGSRRINAQREDMRRARLAAAASNDTKQPAVIRFPRADFVATKIARAFACYLAWDLVMVANKKLTPPGPDDWWSLQSGPMLRLLWLEILMGITVYAGMTMQFDVAAAIGVTLRLNEPEVGALLLFLTIIGDLLTV